MIIRKAEKSDIPELARILHQVNDIHADIRPDIFIHGQRKYSDEQLEQLLQDPDRPVFVALFQQNVVGYAFCEVQTAEGENLRQEKMLYLDDLCIDAESRGTGVGSRLFEYVEDYARSLGCRRVTLNVWEGNTSAQEFYRRKGMSPLKTVLEKIL